MRVDHWVIADADAAQQEVEALRGKLEKAEAAVKKNNTVFADEAEGPRVSNVLFAKGQSKAALGETRTASITEGMRSGRSSPGFARVALLGCPSASNLWFAYH